jgi:hypothetical protein
MFLVATLVRTLSVMGNYTNPSNDINAAINNLEQLAAVEGKRINITDIKYQYPSNTFGSWTALIIYEIWEKNNPSAND